jgi:nucleoside-diphosphate-sugar epimerase
MKVLVMGGSGYVGRNVVRMLADQGAEPVSFDVAPPRSEHATAGVPFVRGDMANMDEVMKALVEHEIQRMVVVAYIVAPLLSPDYRDLVAASRVNVLGIANVFESARLARVERVIYASTIGVFGHRGTEADDVVTENTPMSPVHGAPGPGLYSLMKAVNNQMAERYEELYDIRIAKVHSAAVIGAGNTAFSQRMIQLPALGQPGVANFPSSAPRNIVGVADISQLYTKMALADEVRHNNYLGTGPAPTGREIADIVTRYLPEAQITFAEDADVHAWNFDNSRAVNEFNWQLQSAEGMILSEINDTRIDAGMEPVG